MMSLSDGKSQHAILYGGQIDLSASNLESSMNFVSPPAAKERPASDEDLVIEESFGKLF